jgi:hypothetical protein
MGQEAPGGFEPPNNGFADTLPISPTAGQDSDLRHIKDRLPQSSPTTTVEPAPLPPDLTLIIDHWDSLPDPLKAGIVAMVQASLAAPGITVNTANLRRSPRKGGPR